jgi:hypothetical protein
MPELLSDMRLELRMHFGPSSGARHAKRDINPRPDVLLSNIAQSKSQRFMKTAD